MHGIIKLTVLLLFFAVSSTLSGRLNAQDSSVAEQQDKVEGKKIDVEMLGLDDVKNKVEPPLPVADDPPPSSVETLPKASTIAIPTPLKKELESNKEDKEDKKNKESGEDKSDKKGDKKDDKEDLQQEDTGIIGKIKSFIDKKTDKENKKIILKLGSEKKSEEEKDSSDLEKEREIERLAQEKQERLNRLREEYLIKISKDGKAVQTEDDLIIPRKKQLNWGDSFYKTVDVAPPLISRSRSDDNSHIPIIPTFKEKIDNLFTTIRSNDISAFNNFYAKIAIPDLRNQKGDTILTYALLLKRHPVISSILSKGADPDLPNTLGHSPLDIAIENLDLKSVKILIDNHANINYTDKYDRTYLMLAVRKGYLPIVQLLVESGADVNASDNYGRTALTIAYRHKKEIVAKYLIKNGAKAWIEKPYERGNQNLIRELENRWKTPRFNSQ